MSGTVLLGQLYVLPHWDRSCRSNSLSHRVNQSLRWSYNARKGSLWSSSFSSPWCDPTEKSSTAKAGIEPMSATLEVDVLPPGQGGGQCKEQFYMLYRSLPAPPTVSILHAHMTTELDRNDSKAACCSSLVALRDSLASNGDIGQFTYRLSYWCRQSTNHTCV